MPQSHSQQYSSNICLDKNVKDIFFYLMKTFIFYPEKDNKKCDSDNRFKGTDVD